VADGDPLLLPLVNVVNAIALGNPTQVEDRPVTIAGVHLLPESDVYTLSSADGILSVQRADFFAVLDQLMAERLPDEAFWLMRPDPIFWRASTADRLVAEDLERRIEVLDGTNLVQRRAWLFEAEAGGVLSHAGERWRRRVLMEAGCARLVLVMEAVRVLERYFESEARRAVLGEPPPLRILGAGVSLDWARRAPSLPGGYELDHWTARCEAELQTATRGESPTGEFFLREAGTWFRVSWIRDDGINPAIRGAELV
jgi:hypothetical protein